MKIFKILISACIIISLTVPGMAENAGPQKSEADVYAKQVEEYMAKAGEAFDAGDGEAAAGYLEKAIEASEKQERVMAEEARSQKTEAGRQRSEDRKQKAEAARQAKLKAKQEREARVAQQKAEREARIAQKKAEKEAKRLAAEQAREAARKAKEEARAQREEARRKKIEDRRKASEAEKLAAEQAREAARAAKEAEKQAREEDRREKLEARKKASEAKKLAAQQAREEARRQRSEDRSQIAEQEEARRIQIAKAEQEKQAEEEAKKSAEQQALEAAKNAEEEARRQKEEDKKQKKEEREKAKTEAEAKRKADAAAKEQAKEKARQERKEKIVQKYAAMSRRYLDKGKYNTARRYASLAQKADPMHSDVMTLITDINKAELYGARPAEEQKKEEKVQKALEKTEKAGDPLTTYDEPKGWMDYATEVFEKKTYTLDNAYEGKVYTIDECVDTGLKKSQKMIVADRQVKLAEMRLWEKRRDLMPTMTGKIERSVGKISTGTGPRHYQGEKYALEIKQNCFDGFGAWYTMRQSQANLDIVKLENAKIKNELVEDIKEAYYTLDKNIKALNVHKRLKDVVNKFYQIIESSSQEDLIPRVEYLKVKGQNAQANFQYDSSTEDISLAQMILVQAMSMPADMDIVIKPVPRPKEPLSIGLENCYNLAVANRPSLKIKEKMIEYYELDRKAKKARGWPKVEFQGSFGTAYEAYQPTVNDDEQRQLQPEWYTGIKIGAPVMGSTLEYNYVREFWSPTVSAFRGSESATSYLNLKILDDLAYFSDIEEARVGFESAKQEYIEAKKDVLIEVKETYFKYRKSLLQMDVSDAKVEHQKMYVDVLEERRRFGEMEISKVIEEYEKLANDEYGLVDADTSYYIALVKLNKAIGVPDYFKPQYEDEEYDMWQNREE